MNCQPFNKPVYGKILSVLLLLLGGLWVQAQDNSLTAIGSTKGVPAAMKMSELRSVLKGERQRWNDGTKVSIVLMKTTTSVGEFTCKKIYNLSGDKVKRYWLGLTFSGKAEAPTFCNSIEELEAIIAQTPGAIGIIDKASPNSGIKLIMVDGKNSF